MTRAIQILGFVALFAVAGVLSLLAWLRPEGWVRFRESVSATCRTRWARAVVLFVWAWLGWHFLAR
ncbi:DUF6186 family protein [Flindersiella endophytica]